VLATETKKFQDPTNTFFKYFGNERRQNPEYSSQIQVGSTSKKSQGDCHPNLTWDETTHCLDSFINWDILHAVGA
jgi:hypothetical protein